MKEFPAQLSLSLLYFKVHPEGENFVNGNVYIPQDLAYGIQQRGQLITPFSALIFEVELLDILEE